MGRSLQAAFSSHEISSLDHATLDITSLDAVRHACAAFHPEIVINAAACNNVDRAETDATAAYLVNALGPRNLAIAAAESGAAVLHVSTDYVFDGTNAEPYHEYDQPNPLSVYGRSKLAGEEAAAAANPRCYIVRTALLYHEEGTNFPTRMLEQREKPMVRVVNDQFGSPTYAPHLAEAIGKLITSDAYGIYHFAGSGGASMFEWTRELYRLFRIETPIVPVTAAEFPRPAVRPAHSILTTIQDPRIVLPPWQEGLAEFARKR
ncbi:MAG: dTDP-4-dehydrorhamnose reductase [Acidobacteriota bacterium]